MATMPEKLFSKMKPTEKFAAKWGEFGLKDGEPETEFLFDSGRKWRFDFAWPRQKVAVEIDGFGFGHQAVDRLAENHAKQHAAVVNGWRVLRYTSRCLGSKQKAADAVEQVCLVLCGVK